MTKNDLIAPQFLTKIPTKPGFGSAGKFLPVVKKYYYYVNIMKQNLQCKLVDICRQNTIFLKLINVGKNP